MSAVPNESPQMQRHAPPPPNPQFVMDDERVKELEELLDNGVS